MTLRVQVPADECRAERIYIAEVLLRDRLGLEVEVVPAPVPEPQILGEDGRRLRVADGFFPRAARNWLEPASMPVLPVANRILEPGQVPGLPAGGALPVLFGDAHGPLSAGDDRTARLDLDVFGTAFFLLSRYEERVELRRDWAERFPSEASTAWRGGFLHRPLADECLELLWSQLRRLWPSLVRRAESYSLELSHDLDWPFGTVGVPFRLALRKLAGDVLVRRCPWLGLRRAWSLLAPAGPGYAADPNNTFEFIMDVDERHGRPSTFFFIAGHTGDGLDDGVYDLDQPWIRHLVRRFRDRGHEIGIHPSFRTFRDGAALGAELANLRRAAEAEGVRQPVWGGRQHYLRWEAPTTWRIYDEAGLDYDSSVGFADRPGFRCGTCHPFRAYDLLARRPLRLVERPLVAMDGTIFWKDYLDLSTGDALAVLGPLVEQCRAYAGQFTLLWHNTRLLTSRERLCYRQVLDMAA